MKNYYYTLEIKKTVFDHFIKNINNINSFSEIELKSKFHFSERDCCEAVMIDLKEKIKFLENKFNTSIQAVTILNPIKFEQIPKEEASEELLSFWPDEKLAIFCASDVDNNTYFIRYSIYSFEDDININTDNISYNSNSFYNSNLFH